MNAERKSLNDWRLGTDYFYGLTGRKNYRKAFPHLLEAAIDGELHCRNLVAYCYSLGLGVAKDIQYALFWYRLAAKCNHPEALFSLALFYANGEGVEED